jgi:hypothetical protein
MSMAEKDEFFSKCFAALRALDLDEEDFDRQYNLLIELRTGCYTYFNRHGSRALKDLVEDAI